MQGLGITRFVLYSALCGLMLPGCKKDAPTEASRTPEAKAPEPVPSSIDAAPVAAAPSCSFDGNYRFRFFSNGHQGWWFRFDVSGAKATLLEEVPMLSLKPGELPLTLDTESCSLELRADSSNAGAVAVTLSLDMQTLALAGKLTREKAHNDKEKNVDVTGAFLATGTKLDEGCVQPGIYELVFDSEKPWRTEDEYDDRDCSDAARFASPLVIRVEPYGEHIAVSMRDLAPPYEELWATNEFTRKGACEVDIALGNESTTLEGGLLLSDKGITGLARKASYQFVEDGTLGENIWTCIGEKVPLKLRKLQ